MASQEERDRIMAEYMASVQNDDDDDDDEAEFHPGMMDDDDDDDDDDDLGNDQDDDDDDAILVKGILSYSNGKLSYKGNMSGKSFDLQSPKNIYWDMSSPTAESSDTSAPTMRSLTLTGTLPVGNSKSGDNKSIQVNIQQVGSTTTTKGTKGMGNDGGASKKQASFKSTGDDDDDDDETKKKPSKASSVEKGDIMYNFVGNGSGFDFVGTFAATGAEEVALECHLHTAADTAAPAAAAAAKAPDDDEEADVDEGIDYNELIALHEDAGLPMTELRKRYRSNNGAAEAPPGKKKPPPPCDDDDDDDDDDEDIGF